MRGSRRKSPRSRGTCAWMSRKSCRVWSATWPRTASPARRANSPPGRSTRRSASPPRLEISSPRKRGCWCGARSRPGTPGRSPSCATRWRVSRKGSSALGRLLRLARIFAIALRYGLLDLGADSVRPTPRAVRLRQALEALGPIFVKFGQILSTRRDLLPLDVADELAKLQDRVPPFAADLAAAEIERSLGIRIADTFASFQREAEASASIAQVHFATLK